MRTPNLTTVAFMPGPNDIFADLEPKRRRSEISEKLLELQDSIRTARSRGISWKAIAARLREVRNIQVSEDHLRKTMERLAADNSAEKSRVGRTRTSSVKRSDKVRTVKATSDPAALESLDGTNLRPEDQAIVTTHGQPLGTAIGQLDPKTQKQPTSRRFHEIGEI